MSKQSDSSGFQLNPKATDNFDNPALWSGCLMKRIIGYVIDILVIGIIEFALGMILFLTLGLLTPIISPLMVILPFLYHTYFISSRGATIGQSFAGLSVVDADTGANPSLLQALILTVLFYISLSLSFVPLLYVFLDTRDRFLHDIFSNTRTLNRESLDAAF